MIFIERLQNITYLCITIILALPTCSSATETDLSVNDVMERCRLAWRSLETLQFTQSEFNVENDRIARERGFTRYEFSQASGGKRSLVVWGVYPDREELVENFRQDGRRRYTIVPYDGHPEVAEKIGINIQPDSDDYYEGTMSSLLWLIVPAGKPAYVHLEEGGRLVADHQDNDGGLIAVQSTFKEQPLLILIDPERDWLPVKVEIEGSMSIVATKFDTDNGRWFPVEGRMTKRQTVIIKPDGTIEENPGNQTIEHYFKVASFRINQPLASSSFSLPRVENGVMMVDMTGREVRTEVQGGESAYQERAARYSPPSNTTDDALADPITASRKKSAWLNAYSFIGLGVAALLAALGVLMHKSSSG